MTREQMLAKLGIGDGDFRDYLEKSSKFIASLNEAQLAYHTGSRPPTATTAQVSAWFGPDVTARDITELFAEAPPTEGVLFTNWGERKSGGGV
jgi:hypothetical protein